MDDGTNDETAGADERVKRKPRVHDPARIRTLQEFDFHALRAMVKSNPEWLGWSAYFDRRSDGAFPEAEPARWTHRDECEAMLRCPYPIFVVDHDRKLDSEGEPYGRPYAAIN